MDLHGMQRMVFTPVNGFITWNSSSSSLQWLLVCSTAELQGSILHNIFSF